VGTSAFRGAERPAAGHIDTGRIWKKVAYLPQKNG
jgi:hypothetical protein